MSLNESVDAFDTNVELHTDIMSFVWFNIYDGWTVSDGYFKATAGVDLWIKTRHWPVLRC